jgi:hypothetical protein
LQFAPDLLVAEAEALQERRRLGVLQGRVRRAWVDGGRRLCLYFLFLPDPCAVMSLRADFRACILHRVDPSMPLGGLGLRWRWRRRILRDPDGGSLRGYGLRLCLFLGRPGLELLEQFFGHERAGLALGLDLGLALTGLGRALAALGLWCLNGGRGFLLARFDRLHSRGNFLARGRVRRRRDRILAAGDGLNR